MYPQFILYLLKLIKYQEKIILALVSIILGKSVARGLYDEPINKPYRKLEVDTMPVIEKLEKFDYLKLLEAYELKHKKRLKPVQRRKKQCGKSTGKHHLSSVLCTLYLPLRQQWW